MLKLRLLVPALFVALAGSGAGTLAAGPSTSGAPPKSPRETAQETPPEAPAEELPRWIGKPRSEIKQRFGEPEQRPDRSGSWQYRLKTPQGIYPLRVFFDGDQVSAFEMEYEPAPDALQAIPSKLHLIELPPSGASDDAISPIRQLAHPASGRVWEILPNSKTIRLTVTRPWEPKAGTPALSARALLQRPFPLLPKAVRAEPAPAPPPAGEAPK